MLLEPQCTGSISRCMHPLGLEDLIDATLTCEDANSKLVEVITVADVDAEDHAGNIFLIWELMFGHTAKLLFRL